MKIAAIIVAIAFVAIGFQNCGSNGFEAVSGQATSLSNGGVLKPLSSRMTAPSHVPVSSCAEIKIELLIQPATPQSVEFATNLSAFLFLDPSCEGETVKNRKFTTDNLPISLFFRSEHLFQQEISVKVGGEDSNKVLLTAYKRHFADVTKSSPGSLLMQSNHNFRQRVFNFYNSSFAPETFTIANIFFGTISPNDTTELPAGSEAISTANTSTVRNYFSKTQVLIANQTIPAVATEIIAPVEVPANQISCYSAMNEVYCQNNLLSAPPAVFQKVNLPPGDIQDLSVEVISLVCAIKSGRVFCWKNDLVAQEVVGLGMDNTSVAIVRLPISDPTQTASSIITAGLICSVADGRVRCLVNGVLQNYGYTGVRRIWTGPSLNAIYIQGFDGGGYYTKGLDLLTGSNYTVATNAKFDELYPLNIDRQGKTALLKGCGRSGVKLLCFEGTDGDLPLIESNEVFDIR